MGGSSHRTTVVGPSHRARRICLENRVGLSASNRFRDQVCRTRAELGCCRSRYSRPEKKNPRSEPAAAYGYVLFSDLPSPEEWDLESIHTGQRKVAQSILGGLVPILPVIPERAVRVRRGISLDAPQVEATVVETIAIFSGESYTKVSLA